MNSPQFLAAEINLQFLALLPSSLNPFLLSQNNPENNHLVISKSNSRQENLLAWELGQMNTSGIRMFNLCCLLSFETNPVVRLPVHFLLPLTPLSPYTGISIHYTISQFDAKV